MRISSWLILAVVGVALAGMFAWAYAGEWRDERHRLSRWERRVDAMGSRPRPYGLEERRRRWGE